MASSEMLSGDRTATGFVDPRFQAVKDEFEEMLRQDSGYSAQLCVVWKGQTIVDLVGGTRLNDRTVTGVYSASKGVAAVVIGMLIDRGLLDLDDLMTHYWPEFGAQGKGSVTVREALAHRAGVIGVPQGFSAEDMTDSRRAAAMIAAAPPLWQPGTTHGYHALSIGVLMEELARRVAGSSLQAFYESEIRAPRGIDFYLGFPEAEEVRFREVNPPETPEPDLKPDEWRPTDGLQAIAFNVLGSDLPPTAGPLSPNNRSMRAAGIAAIGGIGSARGLADVYAAVLGDPTRAGLISSTTMELMSRQHTFGLDRVLGFTTSFGIVFMKPHPQLDFGSYSAFGHDGAGGALAFADPSYDLAFGYIPLPMQPPGGADPKAVRLTQRIRTIIRELP